MKPLVLSTKQRLILNFVAVTGLGVMTWQSYRAADRQLDAVTVMLVLLLAWNLGDTFERVRLLLRARQGTK